MIKLTRLFTLLFAIFIPIYILIIYLPIQNTFEFTLSWLPDAWTSSSNFWFIIVDWVAPILFCGGWIFFMFALGKRFAATTELMIETSSSIATHYIIFYGICAVVMLISFLLPLFTPIVCFLSYSSIVFQALTSKVTWKELDDKTKKFVKILTIIIDIPVVFCTILVLPEILVLSWNFFIDFWTTYLTPLYLLMRAMATALPIGNFILLYRNAIQEVEGRPDAKYKGNSDVILIEFFVTAFLFFLAYKEIPFVELLYYIGAFFWVISFFSNLLRGRRAKKKFGEHGKRPQSVASMILFAFFYVASIIFGRTENTSDTFDTIRYIIVGGAAFVFMVLFLLVFIGHPDLEDE